MLYLENNCWSLIVFLLFHFHPSFWPLQPPFKPTFSFVLYFYFYFFYLLSFFCWCAFCSPSAHLGISSTHLGGHLQRAIRGRSAHGPAAALPQPFCAFRLCCGGSGAGQHSVSVHPRMCDQWHIRCCSVVLWTQMDRSVKVGFCFICDNNVTTDKYETGSTTENKSDIKAGISVSASLLISFTGRCIIMRKVSLCRIGTFFWERNCSTC